MQLDRTRIAIRERSYLALLDLGLRVVATHGGALLAALVLGAVPAIVLNHWLLADMLDEAEFPEDFSRYFNYLAWTVMLAAWLTPLVTAGITLYLGQAMFDERPRPGALLAAFFRALPQLLWYQVLWRGACIPPVVTWLWPFAARAYLNEVVLLERNPWRRKAPGATNTAKRAAALHAYLWGELFVQWIIAMLVGLLLVVAVAGSCWLVGSRLLALRDVEQHLLTVIFPAAMWLVLGYLSVVRFLAYLDLRIRREGWEVELLLRAEAARLRRPAA